MARYTVTGFKWFTGTVDGKKMNSGKLFVQIRLDDSRNSAENFSKGYYTDMLDRVNPEILARIAHLPLPFVAEIETERVGNGKESRELVIDVRPIEQPAKPAAAVPASSRPASQPA